MANRIRENEMCLFLSFFSFGASIRLSSILFCVQCHTCFRWQLRDLHGGGGGEASIKEKGGVSLPFAINNFTNEPLPLRVFLHCLSFLRQGKKRVISLTYSLLPLRGKQERKTAKNSRTMHSLLQNICNIRYASPFIKNTSPNKKNNNFKTCPFSPCPSKSEMTTCTERKR